MLPFKARGVDPYKDAVEVDYSSDSRDRTPIHVYYNLVRSFSTYPAGKHLEFFSNHKLPGLPGNIDSRISSLNQDIVFLAMAKEMFIKEEGEYRVYHYPTDSLGDTLNSLGFGGGRRGGRTYSHIYDEANSPVLRGEDPSAYKSYQILLDDSDKSLKRDLRIYEKDGEIKKIKTLEYQNGERKNVEYDFENIYKGMKATKTVAGAPALDLFFDDDKLYHNSRGPAHIVREADGVTETYYWHGEFLGLGEEGAEALRAKK